MGLQQVVVFCELPTGAQHLFPVGSFQNNPITPTAVRRFDAKTGRAESCHLPEDRIHGSLVDAFLAGSGIFGLFLRKSAIDRLNAIQLLILARSDD